MKLRKTRFPDPLHAEHVETEDWHTDCWWCVNTGRIKPEEEL